MPSRAVASAAVVLIGLVWASVGLALLVATEYLESPAAKCAWRSRACSHVHASRVGQSWQGALARTACMCAWRKVLALERSSSSSMGQQQCVQR